MDTNSTSIVLGSLSALGLGSSVTISSIIGVLLTYCALKHFRGRLSLKNVEIAGAAVENIELQTEAANKPQ